MFNNPELHCVVCGKGNQEPDNPGWQNGEGYDCSSYAQRWCENGGFKAGQEWTGGEKYNNPELNCVACGKGNIPGWQNGEGYDCSSYAQRWCENGGFKPGQEWTGGNKYNNPELNCVACGRGAHTAMMQNP